MPPLRLLPPRFLLLAWTAPQVPHLQRVYNSGSANRWHKQQQRLNNEHQQPLKEEQSARQETPAGVKPEPEDQWSQKQQFSRNEQSTGADPELQNLSLFEELFPEENKAIIKSPRRRVIRDSGFPSIEDLERVSQRFPRTREKDSWREALNIAPSIPWSEISPYHEPLLGSDKAKSVRRSVPQKTPTRREAAVLVVSNAASSLAESDFLRIGPKGHHIKSWNSGIMRVIPGRDPQTLEPQGYYFILFSTDAAARAYRHQMIRLHNVLRTHNKDSIMPSVPPPPGFVREGDDIHAIMQAYTIIPASQRDVTARILTRPLRPAVQRLIKDGGYPETATRGSILENKVLFWLDKGFPTIQAIRLLLSKDQKERNLQWKLSGDSSEIIKLGESKAELSIDEAESPLEDRPDPKNRRAQPSKWILAFQDSQEARRFVRSWHQRAIETLHYHSPDGEPSPRVSAELLW